MRNDSRPIKKTSDSRVSMVHMPMPDETNDHGDIYGGHIMRHVDLAGAICAKRHARMRVVTAAVEHMEFAYPAKPGMIMMYNASVNIVAHTSMEVGVRVEAEEPITGDKIYIGTCYLTFVGVGEDGKPAPLPRVMPETEDDRRRMSDAARRMALSRMERKLSAHKSNYFHFSVMQKNYVLCSLRQADHDLYEHLGGLPENAFISLTRGEEGLSLLVEEEHALPVPQEQGACSLLSGIRLIGPMVRDTGGFLSTVSSILEAERIPVISIATARGEYLFIPRDRLSTAIETLRSAGHFVER